MVKPLPQLSRPQAPVARGLPELSLPRSICPVLLFCQHQHFLRPLLAHPLQGASPASPASPQGAFTISPHLQLLLSFLGSDSCTLVCPEDLGGRGEICISSETQSPAQSGLRRKLFMEQTHPWVQLCSRSQDPPSLTPRITPGTGDGWRGRYDHQVSGHTLGPQCCSLLCFQRPGSGEGQTWKRTWTQGHSLSPPRPAPTLASGCSAVPREAPRATGQASLGVTWREVLCLRSSLPRIYLFPTPNRPRFLALWPAWPLAHAEISNSCPLSSPWT